MGIGNLLFTEYKGTVPFSLKIAKLNILLKISRTK